MTSANKDEIIDEIRRHRDAHAKALNYDLKRISKDLQRQERESGIPIVKRPSRKPIGIRKKSSA